MGNRCQKCLGKDAPEDFGGRPPLVHGVVRGGGIPGDTGGMNGHHNHLGAPSSPLPASKTKHLVEKGLDLSGHGVWIAEALATHNRLRARHGAPPLEWSLDCAEKARLAADACATKNTLFHSHSHEYGHGQNAFCGTPGHYGAVDAVESWYSEYRTPGYPKPGAAGTGHFTQLVWLETTHVGMSCDRQGKGFIVANYKPAGNMQPPDPHYVKNVLPLGTRMQERPRLCLEPKDVTATSLTAEVEEILNSVPQEGIRQKVRAHLSSGRGSVLLEFKPPPKGSVKATLYQPTGGMAIMNASW